MVLSPAISLADLDEALDRLTSSPAQSEASAPDLPGFLYRARFDRFDSAIAFTALLIVKRTPRGTWVMDWGKRRFVLSDGRKRYAYPTKREALESFAHRKRKQLVILTAQIEEAGEASAVAEKLLAGWSA